MTTYIKRLLYPLYIYPRVTANTKKKLHELFNFYKTQKITNQSSNSTLRLFSNMEEDGIILGLLASLNIEKGYFIDIGSNDCINSNCANLVFNFDWQGLFIDGNKNLLKIGKRNYKWFGKKNLKFIPCLLSTKNINEVIESNISNCDVDFMSIDIDGNDYAIWKALTCMQPKLVVIENKIEYGNYDIVIPAETSFSASQWGASLTSITKLAEDKGYTLVAANAEGFNSFYMRNDCFQLSGLPNISVEKILNPAEIKKCFYPENVMSALAKQLQNN